MTTSQTASTPDKPKRRGVDTRGARAPRTPIKLAAQERAVEAWRLRVQGLRPVEIAAKLGVARSTVHSYLKREWELLLEEKRDLSGAWLEIELDRLEELYADLPRDEETGRIKAGATEPARKLIETQSKILGLGSRVEISGPGGGPVPMSLQSEEAYRAELAQQLDRIEAAAVPGPEPDPDGSPDGP